MQLRILAHNIRSLHNVGSFFRNCDGAKAEFLYLTGYTGTPPRIQISKVALGSEEIVPWKYYKNPKYILKKLKTEGFTIISLETAPDAINIFTYKPPNKVCLIVGNEVEGIPSSLLNFSDKILEIPMLGTKKSLNVSCAQALAVFTLRNSQKR